MRTTWFGLLAAPASAALVTLLSPSFHVEIDEQTGAVLSIVHPRDSAGMNWISSPINAPWLPLTSRWGLGYADLQARSMHRAFWNSPRASWTNGTFEAVYNAGPLQLTVTRKVENDSLAEEYIFENMGDAPLDLAERSRTATAIYTPFNDHYTNTTDVLENRAHAHVWANGGSSSWVKLTRMGGRGPHLGMVLTAGHLIGYSIESRDTVTSSNTRGVFLLHPDIPILKPGQASAVSWTVFWHSDWDDFFALCASYSEQYVHVTASSLTAFPGEEVSVNLTSRARSSISVNGSNGLCMDGRCAFTMKTEDTGEKPLIITSGQGPTQKNATIFLNVVPSFDDLIASRTNFISTKQQISAAVNSSIGDAYIVYDNQMESMVTYEATVDRNSARERVGMGVLIARWLKEKPGDRTLRDSLARYYRFVSKRIQGEDGYVYDGPIGDGDTLVRLYNWPWVMQLHLQMHDLSLDQNGSSFNSSSAPLQTFVRTVESFYSNGGAKFYPIGVPVLEGLRALKKASNKSFERVRDLFMIHADTLARTGTAYPPSEVNYEQSIVAPAAIFLLEMYRFTGNETYLSAARPHLNLLLLFGGRQPDYRLHDVAIRHWDGHWFGKDRMWGDTFPHYWSSLTAIAMHHYAEAIREEGTRSAAEADEFEWRADGILRANLALFTNDGRGSCAWIYPLTVNGREAHYKDPYANDQDWALAHVLQIRQDKAYSAAMVGEEIRRGGLGRSTKGQIRFVDDA